MQNTAVENVGNFEGDIIFGAPEGHDARILAEKARALMPEDRVLVHVALDDARIAALSELLAFFAPDVHVVAFPAWDCLPYDRVSPNPDITARRVAALSRLISWDKQKERHPRIVLTSVNAALQRVMPRSALEDGVLEVRTGGRVNMDGLLAFLQKNGYSRTETTREPGEYAIRGGIVDLFPPGYEEPLRIDLFGEDVESIRAFDPLSQRSTDTVKGFHLFRRRKFFWMRIPSTGSAPDTARHLAWCRIMIRSMRR